MDGFSPPQATATERISKLRFPHRISISPFKRASRFPNVRQGRATQREYAAVRESNWMPTEIG
jgi:hypothetical protein